MRLDEHIAEVRVGIRGGRFSSERAVSQGIVLRLLAALGWPTYDTQIVYPEFPINGLRVDFGLCHPSSRPTAFVEVKRPGQILGAERQLFEYAFHGGVQLVVLTDGQEWDFFLPAGQGDYSERRVYKLDIVDRDLLECAERLRRYLAYDRICGGEAIKAAREDYENVARHRQIERAIPDAWKKLISEEDDLLIEIVSDKVATICGFKPEPSAVVRFLNMMHTPSGASVAVQPTLVPPPSPIGPAQPSGPEPPPVTPPKPGAPLRGIGVQLGSTFHPARNGIDTLRLVFELFSERDRTFLARFAGLPKHGRSRRYLAENRESLYPGRPDLCTEYSEKLKSGYLMSTNHSKATIDRIISMARNVVDLGATPFDFYTGE